MAMMHVSRSGATLGVFEEEKVREGLKTGEFIGTDLGWMEGMANWRPLAELEDFRTAPAPAPPVTPVAAAPAPVAVTMPPLSLDPAAGTGLPWENRDDSSWFNALVETIQMVLLKPTEAFSVMRREGGFMDPLLYTIILGMFGVILSFGFSFGLQALGTGLGRQGGAGALLGMGMGSIFVLILMPVFIVIGTFIAGGIIHLCLMITGGANQSFETTVRVVSYAAGSANLFQAIPICGAYIAGIYAIVLYCIGLARAHETDTWRAVVAVLLPLVVCCGSLVFICIIFFGALASNWH